MSYLTVSQMISLSVKPIEFLITRWPDQTYGLSYKYSFEDERYSDVHTVRGVSKKYKSLDTLGDDLLSITPEAKCTFVDEAFFVIDQ